MIHVENILSRSRMFSTSEEYHYSCRGCQDPSSKFIISEKQELRLYLKF